MMATESSPFVCVQCSANLNLNTEKPFHVCPVCEASLFISGQQVIRHYCLPARLDLEHAEEVFYGWLADSKTASDLHRYSRRMSTTFHLFPLWVVRARLAGIGETTVVKPAQATSVSELAMFKLNPADLQAACAESESPLPVPSVPVEELPGWLKEKQMVGEALDINLVHVPIYTIKYVYQKRLYTAMVESTGGRVFANLFPTQAMRSYRRVVWLTLLVFASLAVLPVMAAYFGNNAFGIAIRIAVVLGFLAAIPLFLLAKRAASRR